MPYTVDPSRKLALDVDSDFTWETVLKGSTQSKFLHGKQADKAKEKREPRPEGTGSSDDAEKAKTEEKPFEVKDVKLEVPKGAFVAIVRRVGSGKVSTSGLCARAGW